jgi:ABC-type transport system substrate-binding protein
MLKVVDKVEAVDKYTVKFTLKEPSAWFLDTRSRAPWSGPWYARKPPRSSAT